MGLAKCHCTLSSYHPIALRYCVVNSGGSLPLLHVCQSAVRCRRWWWRRGQAATEEAYGMAWNSGISCGWASPNNVEGRGVVNVRMAGRLHLKKRVFMETRVWAMPVPLVLSTLTCIRRHRLSQWCKGKQRYSQTMGSILIDALSHVSSTSRMGMMFAS